MLQKAAVLTVILLALAGGFGTKTAKAHIVCRANNYKCAKANFHHAKTSLAWVKTHKRQFHNYRLYRATLKNHRWLYQWSLNRMNKLLSLSRPPHFFQWLCIHRYEGSWTDDGSPYYGGLQMDWNFMRTYGPKLLATKGTANNWTPTEQMWVAENALAHGRGFYPWPNSARMCGLI